MGNEQYFLHSSNSKENKQDDEVAVMYNLKINNNKELDHEHCLAIHYTLVELVSKANGSLCFEVLVQKLLPCVDITQCMQQRETACLLGHYFDLRVRNFPLHSWHTSSKKSNCLYGKVTLRILHLFRNILIYFHMLNEA